MKLGGRAPKTAVSAKISLILFRVDGFWLAIESQAVDEIREARDLQTLLTPAASTKVRLSFRKHGVDYFVIDSCQHYRLTPTRMALLLVLRDLPVAIGAAEVDRMVEASAIDPLPWAFRGEERRWYKGLARLGATLLPVVDPESFLSADELEQLQRRARLGGAR